MSTPPGMRTPGRQLTMKPTPEQQKRLRAFLARCGYHKAMEILHTTPTTLDKLIGPGVKPEVCVKVMELFERLEKTG